MDILESIIEHLTSDEVRRFKILSNRFKADEEKKLLVLFDAIRGGGYKEVEADVITQLYGNTLAKSKNNYYRLRNKLLSNLEKSLLFYHFNYKNSIESFSNVQLSMLLKERGLYKEAAHYLKKAEKTAISYDQFSLLEVIYDEYVRLAVKHPVDIEAIIERRKENLQKLNLLRQTTEVLGIITQQLKKRNFARSKRSESVIEVLQGIQQGLEEHQHLFKSPSGQIMIFKTVTSILIQKEAYLELANYLAKTIDDFERENLFNVDTHDIRLQMRTWRINSLQKLLQISEVETDLKKMEKELCMYNRQKYNEYAFYFYMGKINTLILSNKLPEAYTCMQEALQQKEVISNDTNRLYLFVTLAELHFSLQNFEAALEVIAKVQSDSHIKSFDESYRFYIAIFSLICRFEYGDHKGVEQEAKKFRKKFRQLLKDEFFAKAERFMSIFLRMNKAQIEGRKVFLKAAYRNFVTEFPQISLPDNEIIMYDVYLKSKIEQTSYFSLFHKEVMKQVKV